MLNVYISNAHRCQPYTQHLIINSAGSFLSHTAMFSHGPVVMFVAEDGGAAVNIFGVFCFPGTGLR